MTTGTGLITIIPPESLHLHQPPFTPPSAARLF